MKIRVAKPADGECIASIYAPIVENSFISFETEVPSVDEMSRRIEATLVTHPWLVCEENGRVLGYVYAGRHRERPAYQWSADVSAYLAPQVRRRGLARLLYARLFDILAAQGIASAFAGIALPNEASVGLHEATGFKPIGVYPGVGYKNGKWCDVGWWHRQLQELDPKPTPPVPFSKLPKAKTGQISYDSKLFTLPERM
ncbi:MULTISPECIES: arsinothricin resistance N-acetyltransferase ArsN1 family B [Alphaproteobacteria]|uniref:arsinothricin resistance N-acetyltransferase ArsN1 family B n=1 Tax=Alphaproteobacteria TaxID=28211 RepID=UPI00326416B7